MTTKSDKERPQGDYNLRIPRAEVRLKLEERIVAGKEMLERPISTEPELGQLWHDYQVWDDYNAELLKRCSSSNELQEEYSKSPGFWSVPMHPTFEETVANRRGDIRLRIVRLQSIVGRLDLIPEETVRAPAPSEDPSPESTSARMFLVHGHDTGALGSVEAFLRKLNLAVTILRDEPNKGQTIIEKVESNAGVGFAVVLLTGDDEGHQRQANDALLPRARQNVIFELGYFIGLLGRSRVCALYEDGVELPSDYSGVTFIRWSKDESWKLLLLRELKAAGLPVDANAAL